MTTTPAIATAIEASVFGTVDKISVAIAKPNQKARAVKTAASPLAGATVAAFKSNGTSAGNTTTAMDGTYTLLLTKNGIYVIKITSGNIVMNSVHAVGTADATINVNPGTTAALVILENQLGITFYSGTASCSSDPNITCITTPATATATTISTTMNGVDVNATLAAIAATSGFTTTANAVSAAVAANTDPTTDTTVTTAATTAATTVTTVSLVGTWVGSWSNDSAHTDTFTFTSNTMTSVNTNNSNCTETNSYTTNAGNVTFTLTGYSDAVICNNMDGPVGTIVPGTYSISGSTLTMVLTVSSGTYTYTGTKQ